MISLVNKQKEKPKMLSFFVFFVFFFTKLVNSLKLHFDYKSLFVGDHCLVVLRDTCIALAKKHGQ